MNNNLVTSFDPRLLLDALVIRWRIILVAALVAPVFAVVANMLAPATYQASATIIIQDSVAVNPFLSEISVEWEVNTRLPIVHAVVSSRETARKILTALGEIDEDSPAPYVNWAFRDFQARTQVIGNPGGVIEISFRAGSANNALRGLELIMEEIGESLLGPQRESLDASVTFLDEQLERLRGEIDVREQAIRGFRDEHATQTPELHALQLDQYSRMVNLMTQAQSDLASETQQLLVATERIQSFDPQIRRLDERIDEARQEYESLARTYTDSHPEVVSARDHLAGLRADREAQVADAQGLDINDFERLLRSGSIRSSDILNAELTAYRDAMAAVEGLRERISSMRERVGGLEAELRAYQSNEQQLERMIGELDATQSAYENLLRRYQDAVVSRELTLEEEKRQIWTVEPPELPTDNDKLGLPIVVILGGMIGSMFGLLIIAAAEFLDPTVRLPREAAEISGVPVLASIPPLDA